jgi:hypothetical protein
VVRGSRFDPGTALPSSCTECIHACLTMECLNQEPDDPMRNLQNGGVSSRGNVDSYTLKRKSTTSRGRITS